MRYPLYQSAKRKQRQRSFIYSASLVNLSALLFSVYLHLVKKWLQFPLDLWYRSNREAHSIKYVLVTIISKRHLQVQGFINILT